jgi:hypothetical protein
MRKLTLFVFAAALLALLLSVACSKKPAGGLPASEIPPDGVSSVPPPADRDPNMPPPDPAVAIAGAVKEVRSKILDKEADDKTKALLHVKVLALDGPIDVSENTRWEFWKPGSDPEEQKPEADGWSSSEAAVPAGTWDVRFKYAEGDLCKADGWVRNITFTAGKLWKAEVVLAAPMQYVRIFGTINDDDAGDNVRVDLFKAGTDQSEFHPLTSFWSTQKVVIPAGTYDLRLTYDKDEIKAKGALNNFTVSGNRGILKATGKLKKL